MSSFNGGRRFFHCPPNCENRRPACQSTCPTYIRDKANWEKLKAAERKRKEVDYYVAEYMAKNCDARIKSKKEFGKSVWRRVMK